MPIKTYREAVKEALAQEMEHDERVVLIGEDLRGGHGGNAPEEARIEAFGGVLGVTKGLWTQFGSDRVIDTPITESAIVGMAAGAAATGLRPVAELMFMDFFGVSHDALYNQAAKFRYMFGGKAKAPLVMRGMIGAGFSAAAQHSQSPYNIFATTPGLKVVVPSTPYDVKGLLIQSIRDDDPVVFCEHKMLYDLKGEVPDEIYTLPWASPTIPVKVRMSPSSRCRQWYIKQTRSPTNWPGGDLGGGGRSTYNLASGRRRYSGISGFYRPRGHCRRVSRAFWLCS